MRFIKLNLVSLLIAGLVSSTCVIAQSDSSKVLSQYLFKGFSKGIVKLRNGTVTSAPMNYNTLTEKMVFEQNGKLMDLVNNEAVDTIFINERRFVPYEEMFLEVKSESAIPLYIQYKGDLMSPGKPSAYGGTSQTTSSISYSTVFNDSKTYNINLPAGYSVDISVVYWILLNGKMEKFLSQRQFLKIFKNKEASIRQFMKENKTNFDNEGDIVKLLIYCSGL